VLWTEAAFSACWHGIDQTIIDNAIDEWHRRTLRSTIATIFSHMTRNVSVFVKCDTIFGLLFWKFELLTFILVRQYGNILKVWWEVLYEFYWKFTCLSPVKEFGKSVKNSQLSPWVWRTTFFEHSAAYLSVTFIEYCMSKRFFLEKHLKQAFSP